MSKYLEIADRVRAEINARQSLGKFCCLNCGVRFDTSSGVAKHQVYGCNPANYPAPEPARALPSCLACGSHALYREKSGIVTCETCRGKEGT